MVEGEAGVDNMSEVKLPRRRRQRRVVEVCIQIFCLFLQVILPKSITAVSIIIIIDKGTHKEISAAV